jgi:hypothetical protein
MIQSHVTLRHGGEVEEDDEMNTAASRSQQNNQSAQSPYSRLSALFIMLSSAKVMMP